MKSFFDKYIAPFKFIILVEIVIFFVLLVARGHYLYLGGEGNYFLNPAGLFNFDGYSWKSLESAGFPNPVVNFGFIIFNFIWILSKIGMSYNYINLLLVFLVYSLPLLSMYWLAKKIFKFDGFTATLISLFYIFNPFSVYHIQGLMFWNIAPLVLLPIFFGIIFKYYSSNPKLFLFSGLACFFASFSFSNIPYLGIFQIFIVISLFVIPLFKERKITLREYLSKFVIIESAFVLFSSWWLFNLIRFQLQDLNVLYSKDIAVSWAKYAIGEGGIIQKLFSFKALIPPTKGYFFSDFYNSVFGNVIMILPFLALVCVFIFVKNKKTIRTLSILTLVLLIIMFLNKGVNQPLSFLYIWMLDKIPFFIIFKSPLEKFSVLFLFFFTITILFLMISKKNRKILNCVFVIYILFAAIPFIALKFMPDFSIGINKFVSRRFEFKQEYQQVIAKMNSDKLYYKYLSLPGSLNYQVTMQNHDNKYYRGMDPLLYAINKPFIAAYSGDSFKVLYNNLSAQNIENIMGAFSIRKIMINSDIAPAFGFLEKESPTQLKNLFSKNMATEQFGNVGLYTLKSYIPVIYTPTREIIVNNPSDDQSDGSASVLAKMVSSNFTYGSVIVPANDSSLTTDKIIDLPEADRPTIEFKKINEVKYRVVIHNLKQDVPLIFNESFNKGWKLYQSSVQNGASNPIDNYGLNSLEDAATKGEITSFIDEKVISKAVNDQGESDFISKSFNKTIQNDNLSDGKFYETWSNSAVLDTSHAKVNGYANSWSLDPNKLCNRDNKCTKNADGSYDTELVLEFAPQKLYYLGWAVTGSTLIIFIPVFIYLREGIRKKRTKRLIVH